VEFVASLSQGRTAAAQCGLFTYKSVPVIFEPPCILHVLLGFILLEVYRTSTPLNYSAGSVIRSGVYAI